MFQTEKQNRFAYAPKTKIAEGTIDILQMNHPDAIIER